MRRIIIIIHIRRSNIIKNGSEEDVDFVMHFWLLVVIVMMECVKCRNKR